MRIQSIESFLQDFRLAVRGLRKTPVFTLVAVCSLALGIGANTAIFSFVNAIVLKRLPVPTADRLVQVSESGGAKEMNAAFSYPFLHELNKRNKALDGLFGHFPVRVNLTSSGVAEPLNGEVVTGAYFQTLQIQPLLGRLITEEDVEAAVGNPVCVLSYSTWQERFNGDAGIVGRKLILNGRPYTVIGVTPRGFYGPSLQSKTDLQLPVSRMGDFMGGFFSTIGGQAMWKSPNFRWLQSLGRLKPGLTLAQAQAMLQPLARDIASELADPHSGRSLADSKTTLRLLEGSQGFNFARTKFAEPLGVLMGVVGVVLLIACANLANLLLARANARKKEFAIRLSLGASRTRLVRQLMVESLTIAACGGVLGLVLSFWIVEILLALLNSGKAAAAALHVSPDPLVIGFSLALSLLTAVLFGLAPAWQSVRPDVVPELKDVSAAARDGRDRTLLRKSLIAVQIALSLVILFAAGLLTRTLSRLQTIDLGFKPSNVVALSVDPAMNGHSPADTNRIFDEILSRLRSQPGIAAAGLAVISPLEGMFIQLDLEVPGHLKKKSDVSAGFDMVSPGYFAAVDQPLLLGRDFSDRDVKKAPRVAIVNEFFVSQYMPGQNPVGRRFKSGGGDVEIVGMVKTAHYQTLREPPRPIVYLPAKQTQSSGYTLLVRTAATPRSAIPDIERAIRAVDPKLPIYNVRTLQAQIDQGISSERVLSFLSALFSGLATLLCGMGLYGIAAYTVSRRTREIGVRFAVGAQRSDIASLFVRETVLVIGTGILVGIPAALVSTRILKNLLYGLEPTDVPTLAFTVAVLVLAGLLAIFLPVRRASRIEPLEALRYE